MDEFIKWFGFIGTFIGIIGIIGTYFSWKAWSESEQTKKLIEREKARLNEKVAFVLTDGTRHKELPALRRQEVTRSEVQGRLGTIPMKNKGSRYSIEYTNSQDFYNQVNKTLEGSSEQKHLTLTINCTTGELDQFDFEPTSTVENKKPEAEKVEKKVRTRKNKAAR